MLSNAEKLRIVILRLYLDNPQRALHYVTRRLFRNEERSTPEFRAAVDAAKPVLRRAYRRALRLRKKGYLGRADAAYDRRRGPAGVDLLMREMAFAHKDGDPPSPPLLTRTQTVMFYTPSRDGIPFTADEREAATKLFEGQREE